MPFTPFHFGPGATVKGLSPRYFSFSVFCFAQVIMDLEVPFLMARNADRRWHGWSHTLVGDGDGNGFSGRCLASVSAPVALVVCSTGRAFKGVL